MSMSALSRSASPVDREPLALHGGAKARPATLLIFDLIGVWKSKFRGSPWFLRIENRGNQNLPNAFGAARGKRIGVGRPPPSGRAMRQTRTGHRTALILFKRHPGKARSF